MSNPPSLQLPCVGHGSSAATGRAITRGRFFLLRDGRPTQQKFRQDEGSFHPIRESGCFEDERGQGGARQFSD